MKCLGTTLENSKDTVTPSLANMVNHAMIRDQPILLPIMLCCSALITLCYATVLL